MTPQEILKRPIITERATTLSERFESVAFEVAKDANKHQIRQAVEKSIYGVDNGGTHVMRNPGKIKRRAMSIGKRPSWEKKGFDL
ncbi:MAG: 50S ribosomal protein L23 [Myxococcota bacterium]